MKWAMATDLHVGVRGDSKIFHEIQRKFFKEWIAEVKIRECTAVIIPGDVFERRKFINFETLHIAKEILFDPLQALGIPVYFIAGNHDVYFKNTNRVNSLDILLSKETYSNFNLITQTAEEVTIDGQKVLFVPWVNRENIEDITSKINNSLARYMVAHLDMAGFEMHKGAISEHGHFEADFLTKFEKVITGHYHTRSSKGNIHYLGTPYETTWNDYGEEKGWHILEDGELEFVKTEINSFYRYVYDDRQGKPSTLFKVVETTGLENKFVKLIVRGKKNLKDFERFIQMIEEKSPADLNILDETNFVCDVEEDEDEAIGDTLSIIKKFIDDELETDLDKSMLYLGMASLYQSALEVSENDD